MHGHRGCWHGDRHFWGQQADDVLEGGDAARGLHKEEWRSYSMAGLRLVGLPREKEEAGQGLRGA